jgi:hypothetical protein
MTTPSASASPARPVRVADGDTCPACGQPHKRRNAGQLRAREAARAVGGVVASPEWADPAGRWQGYQDTRKAPPTSTTWRTAPTTAKARRGAPHPRSGPRLAGRPAGRRNARRCTTPAPEAETPASGPESAPAAPSDEPEKPAKRTRSKAKGKAPGVQAPAQGGEVFELRDGNEGRGVYRLKVERRGEGWEPLNSSCAPSRDHAPGARRPGRELAAPGHVQRSRRPPPGAGAR